MDTAFRSLLRQYTANSDDNELAHKIAKMAIRTTAPSEPKSFEEEIKEYQEFVEANTEALGDKIGASLQALIAKYPLVEAIQWTQYTPSFNDGDACLFGVNDLHFKLRDETEIQENASAEVVESEEEPSSTAAASSPDEDEDDDDAEDEDDDEEDEDDDEDYDDTDADEGFVSRWELDKNHPSEKMFKEIEDVFTSIPEDLMEYAFGNGSRVTISSAAIKIADYHDNDY